MKLLRNCWYMAAWLDAFEERPALARTIAGEPLLLVRAEDGEVAALLVRRRLARMIEAEQDAGERSGARGNSA